MRRSKQGHPTRMGVGPTLAIAAGERSVAATTYISTDLADICFSPIIPAVLTPVANHYETSVVMNSPQIDAADAVYGATR